MAKGKAPISGIVYVRPRLSYAVNTRILRQNRKEGHPRLSIDQVREYRGVICDEIACYVGSTNDHMYLTATEREQELTQFITAVRNLLSGIKADNIKRIDNWKPKVSKRLYELSLDSKKRIYSLFDNVFEDQPHLKRSLDNYIIHGFDERCISILEKIAAADPSKIFYPDNNQYLRDPPLQRLVRRLAPLWTTATGRSLLHVSIDREYNEIRKNFFADWLCQLIADEGALPPNKHAISDIAEKL